MFSLLWKVLVAAASSHLKPGVLSVRLESLWLVEDVLWVRYPCTPLMTFPASLQRVIGDVDLTLGQLAENLPHDFTGSGHLLGLLHIRLLHINSTLSTALEDYAGFDQPSRSKRGLVDSLGQLSNDLWNRSG